MAVNIMLCFALCNNPYFAQLKQEVWVTGNALQGKVHWIFMNVTLSWKPLYVNFLNHDACFYNNFSSFPAVCREALHFWTAQEQQWNLLESGTKLFTYTVFEPPEEMLWAQIDQLSPEAFIIVSAMIKWEWQVSW